MAIVHIAFRNLSRQKKRSFLLATAIAFGIMVITLVNGLVGGVLQNAENNFASLISAHILVVHYQFLDKGRLVYQIQDEAPYKKAVAELAKKYPIASVQKRTSVFNNATLIFQTNSVWRQVDGVDWDKDQLLTHQLELTAGSLQGLKGTDGIVLGEKEAKKLDVQVGERILVQAETIYGQENVLEVPVKAIYKEDNLSSGTAFLDRQVVDSLLNMPPGSFNWYGILLKNFSDQDRASALLQRLLAAEGLAMVPRAQVANKNFNTLFGEIRRNKDKTARTLVTDLNDQLASLKGIFDTIKIVSLAVLMLLLLIIMVGLNNTYRIIVWERNREIGTLRALGMQRNLVSRIFLLEAFFLSMFGVAAGIALATGILSVVGLFDLGGKSGTNDFAIFLHKNHLSWAYDPAQLLIMIALVAGLTLLAAWSPARRAGRVDPAVALRTTA
jgi:putative ABC transport system permease protein